MESETVDAAEFRDGQRQQWNSAATGWRRWSELIDGAASGISERLVELAGVEPGSRVLDVAAGYGEPSLTAARRAGSEGSVLATDISAEMIAFGRERAAATGLENIKFVQSDAASLDFPAASFDAALSRWGIIFEPDAEAAAARIRSFLEPGGRMAISSWGSPDRVPFLAIPMRTAMQRLGVPPPQPGTWSPLASDAPGAGRPAGSGRLLRCGSGGGRGHFRVAVARGVHHFHQGDRPADHRDDRSAPAGGARRDLDRYNRGDPGGGRR